MKPPDSITDGVVVLREVREGDRAVCCLRFGIAAHRTITAPAVAAVAAPAVSAKVPAPSNE